MSALNERVIIVTGGANGIGESYCEDLVRGGARVVIADIDGEGAHRLSRDINCMTSSDRTLGVSVDVTSPTDTTAMVDAALTAFGRIDVLVNNAGSYPHVAFADIDYTMWREVMCVNLDSVFLCAKAAVPVMSAQGSGAMVNVATNLVWSGLANMSHYISAKSGVIGFTKSLARELGPLGITVNAIAPGAVIPQQRLSRAGEDVADEIVRHQAVKRRQTPTDLLGAMRFLCSPESAFISGQVLTVDGGLTMH